MGNVQPLSYRTLEQARPAPEVRIRLGMLIGIAMASLYYSILFLTRGYARRELLVLLLTPALQIIVTFVLVCSARHWRTGAGIFASIPIGWMIFWLFGGAHLVR